MSSNNHALIRYRTIDRCLKSRERIFKINDLIRECSYAVHEYEEKRSKKKRPFKEVSKRSIQYDIQFMKDPDVGFNAPIIYDPVDGYLYTDPQFEAFRSNISQSDSAKLSEALDLLRQVSGGAQFDDIEMAIMRLEDGHKIKISKKGNRIVHFEQSSNELGIRRLSILKKHISAKETLRIRYTPFGKETTIRYISPYFLKEYNNRWFLIGHDLEFGKVTNLGLDRIDEIKVSLKPFHPDPEFDMNDWTEDIVGVTYHSDRKKVKIKLKAYGIQKDYLNTKRIHKSQQLVKETRDYGLFELHLIPNFELESKILSNMDTIEIISPKSLKDQIKLRLSSANKIYFK